MSEAAWHRLGLRRVARRPRLTFTVALAFLFAAIVAMCAIFGSLIAPHDPDQQDLLLGLSSSSAEHWLGTDDLGRDIASRTIVGARTAVVGPILIAFGSMVIGSALGVLAGYRGGWTDGAIMRWADLMYALPAILIAIVVVGVLGGGYFLAVAVLVLLSAPYDTRIVRAATLEQRPRTYVDAARSLGLPAWRIGVVHIWPNILAVVLASAFLNFAFAIVALSSLSYLGLGVEPGTADWGRMLAEGRSLIFENPAVALAPGLLIVLTAASVNWIGDWAYERMSDRGTGR